MRARGNVDVHTNVHTYINFGVKKRGQKANLSMEYMSLYIYIYINIYIYTYVYMYIHRHI